jgi:hypothetical protein
LLGGNRCLLGCLLLGCLSLSLGGLLLRLLLGCLSLSLGGLLLCRLSGLRLLLRLLLGCCLLLCRLRAECGFRRLAGFGRRIAQCAPGWQWGLGIDAGCCLRARGVRTRTSGTRTSSTRTSRIRTSGTRTSRDVLGPALTTPPAKTVRIVRIRVPARSR